MSLSALVYKNRSLSEEELAAVVSKDTETGEPYLRNGDSAYPEFEAKEIFIGNLFGVADLRSELERNAPAMSEAIRTFVLSNGTLSGVGISEPNVLRVASECSNLLAEGRVNLSEPLRFFLVNLSDLAKTAEYENNPIVLI